MSIAHRISTKHLCTTKIRAEAQQHCHSMTRDHRKDKDRYHFRDHSVLVVVRKSTYVEWGVTHA